MKSYSQINKLDDLLVKLSAKNLDSLDSWFEESISAVSKTGKVNQTVLLKELYSDYKIELTIWRYSNSYINKIYKEMAMDLVKNFITD